MLKGLKAQDYKRSWTKLHMRVGQMQLKEQMIRSYFKHSILRYYKVGKSIILELKSKEKPNGQKKR